MALPAQVDKVLLFFIMNSKGCSAFPMDIKNYLKLRKELIDNRLKDYFVRNSEVPSSLNNAMKYSLFAGGKRLRPILLLAAADVCGGAVKDSIPTACAIEMIHTYSLIHDDLPAMDNDDYRRGKLTSHRKFGEAAAILAGDALLTRAFEIMHPAVVRFVASSAGAAGMVGGQYEDINTASDKAAGGAGNRKLRYIHIHKTAMLIEVSLKAGAVIAGASDRKVKAVAGFGKKAGLAFQIFDDLLDITGDEQKLGKKHSDIKNNKLTYPAVYGYAKSKSSAERLIRSAKKELDVFGSKADILKEIADYILTREN